jgi:hypothetical protein
LFLFITHKTEEMLLNVMEILSERITVPTVGILTMGNFFMDCTTVPSDVYSEWCHSVCYRWAENKTKPKSLNMSLATTKHLILHADI